MIDKLSYDQILAVSQEIKKQLEVLDSLLKSKGVQELNDFMATVEGYSKFLETTVEINKDADIALKDLKK